MQMHPYDGPDLACHVPLLPIVIVDAELEIHAVKELVIFGMRQHKQLPQLEAVDRSTVLRRVRSPHRQIESLLKPALHAPGPFSGAVDGVIRNDAAGESGSLAPDRRVVCVYHQVEHTRLRDLGIVYLDLVRLGQGYNRRRNQNEGQHSAAVTPATQTELHFSSLIPTSVHAYAFLPQPSRTVRQPRQA